MANNKRTLIKCGWLVTLDDKIGDHKDGELLFSGNRSKPPVKISMPLPTR